MKNKMTKTWLILLVLIVAVVLAGCDHPAWANYEIVVKDADGEFVESHYCISAPWEGTTFHCKQPGGVVVEIEIKPGYKVQVWTLSKPMP